MANSNLYLFGIGSDGEPAELPVPAEAATVHDALAGLPAGVYSTIRTFGGNRFLGLGAHVDRLESSMRGIGIADPLDREALLTVLDGVATRASAASGGGDSVIRFDALSECVPMGKGEGRLLLAAGPLLGVPEAAKRHGVRVETTAQLHRDDPLVKTTAFVAERGAVPVVASDSYERILLDEHDRLLEGTSSTFFAITTDGELATAADGVLEGVTRRILLERAAELGVPVRFERWPRADLGDLAGAFLCSSSRGVVPIVAIDGEPVADGSVHPLTRKLSDDYDAWSVASAESALDVLRSMSTDDPSGG